jgi:hypothetical protein
MALDDGMVMDNELRKMWQEADVACFYSTVPEFAWRNQGRLQENLSQNSWYMSKYLKPDS